jgi:beta-N-acetylhexosaminidase
MINIKWWTAGALLAAVAARAQTPADSLAIKIGQMIMIGFPGAQLDSLVLKEVAAGKAGAIIFFEKNIPPANSYNGLKKIIWSYKKAAPVPLLVAIDQEGGKVNRLKEKYGFPRSVSATRLGKYPLDSVRFHAESLAGNLAGLGFNLNFAPVVDLKINPVNTVIVKSERAFAKDADSVALYAKEYIRAHRQVGVLTSLKHFPGHGSSTADSHFGVADVTATWVADELKPYRQLISEGYADAVMSAHIVHRGLEPRGYPGTLSGRVLDSLLRRQLGFGGVIFSDDMHMHAISKQYGLEEAVKRAVNAGIDILCFSNNIPGSEARTVDQVYRVIRTAVEQGEISPARIDQSYRRIMNLKARLSEKTTLAQTVAMQQKTIAELQHQLQAAQNKPADTATKKKKRRRQR